MDKPRLSMFEVTEEDNAVGEIGLAAVIEKLGPNRNGAESFDDTAKAIGCMIMLLCEFISENSTAPLRKLLIERVLNIVLAMIVCEGDLSLDLDP